MMRKKTFGTERGGRAVKYENELLFAVFVAGRLGGGGAVDHGRQR